jgi:heme exporter protein CcmD
MLEWLNMAGLWPYVWPAYALALGGVAAILVSALVAHGRAMRALRDSERGPKA